MPEGLPKSPVLALFRQMPIVLGGKEFLPHNKELPFWAKLFLLL